MVKNLLKKLTTVNQCIKLLIVAFFAQAGFEGSKKGITLVGNVVVFIILLCD